MSETEKLYWVDPLATAFETTGARLATFADKPAIVLPRTMFYPEGGGQLGDTGTLAIGDTIVRVADTQIDDGGVIHHLVEGAPATVGDEIVVRGLIDGERRLDHMAQHTAQH